MEKLLLLLSNNIYVILIVKTLMILIIMYLFYLVGKYLVNKFLIPRLLANKRINKVKTIIKIMKCLLVTVLLFLGFAAFLKFVLFVDISSFLTLAGLLSVVIGVASQKIIQDFFNGLFLFLEESITIGDDVDINGTRGIIEDINLHCVYLRATDGSLHVIPNNKLNGYINYTKDINSQ